ncbi:hypothetical protein Tco_0407559 [Tanacetum coccineum]
MGNVNPLVNYLDSKPSCLKGKPKFIMSFREEDLEEEVEEEFEEEEEEDDLEYFNTFSTREDKEDEVKGEGYVSRKRMTHCSKCLKIGPEYKRDEGVQRIENEAKRLGTRWQVWMAALEAQLVARTPEPTMNHLEAHVASSDMWIRNNTVVGSRANDWRYH